MNQIRRTIHDILIDWGQKQRQSPFRNETLKSEVLAKLQPSSLSLEKQIKPQKAPWFSLAFASLAIISLIINYLPITRFVPAPLPLLRVEESGKMSADSSRREFYPYPPYPEPGSDIPITDTREFIKKDYSATIRTRHVEEITQRIQTIARGFDGRVDNSRSSKQWGFVSFVIPASKLDSFRIEIRSLTSTRLFVEEIVAENLLSQKQSIEQQQQGVEKTLAQLRDDREKLKIGHQRIVTSIQSKIDKIENDLLAIEIKLDVISDPAQRKEIKIQQEKLLNEKEAFETDLAKENMAYAKKLNVLGAQILDSEASLDGLIKQDQKLIDTVATVRGTILLNWVSIWSIIQLYAPINLWFVLFVAGAIITYVMHRRRSCLYLPN